MILVDTGALYALADRDDTHHQQARSFFHRVRGQETLAVPGFGSRGGPSCCWKHGWA